MPRGAIVLARHPLAPAFPVMAAMFVGFLVVGMAMPVLPLHGHDDLGFGPFVVGLVSGGQFLAALVSRLWAAHLADTRGQPPYRPGEPGAGRAGRVFRSARRVPGQCRRGGSGDAAGGTDTARRGRGGTRLLKPWLA
jgi:hypothetical protein